jgi:hypothetical protein
MASHYLTSITRVLSQLPPAALLVIVLVAVVMLACALAPLLAHHSDNGLRYEGTYTSRITRHGGKGQ